MLAQVPELCLPPDCARFVLQRAWESQRTEEARLGVRAPRSRRKPQGQSYWQALQSRRAQQEARLLRRAQRRNSLWERLQRERAQQEEAARRWQLRRVEAEAFRQQVETARRNPITLTQTQTL